MFAAARQGDSGGPPIQVWPRPAVPPCSILQRVVLVCALWFGLLGLPAVAASSLYHCTGAGGEAVFSSTTAGYARCKLVSTYASAPMRHASVPLVARHPERSAAPPPRLAANGAFDELQAAVMSTARVVPDRPSRASFVALEGSVSSTARTVGTDSPMPASGAPQGSWDYHEAAAAASLSSTASAADRVLRGAVYRVVRGDGSVEYTNVPPAGRPGRAITMLFTYLATCVACNLHSPIDWNHVRLNVDAYAQTIRAASIESGVDEAFLRAIIHAESAFNPRALSLKGAQGLMQLMPGTAGDMGVHDAFDAEQNIRGGARYLAMLLRNFNGSEQLAAAAYNAGAGAVQRYKGVPPYAETQVYVQRVGVLRKRYSELAHAPLASVGATAGGF
jgi:soluble lytic murein transglycosylase-like protein